MRKIKAGLIALLACIGLAGALAPPAQAATTVTLFSWSGSGWSSGWHSPHWETPAYATIHFTWTYKAEPGCNSGQDHFQIKVTQRDRFGTLSQLDHGLTIGGYPTTNITDSFYISESNDHYDSSLGYNVYWYLGPQTACQATFRIWEYA